MRVLVTGAMGCIGSWVVRNLVADGHGAVAFDLSSDRHRIEAILDEESCARVRWVKGDITKVQDLEAAFAEEGVTHVIHLAALQVPACRAEPTRGAQVNVMGTLNVLEAVRHRADRIRGVVYASSAAVFGPQESYRGRPLTASSPTEPQTHYGIFKVANEGSARLYHAEWGLRSVGIRPLVVYGPGRDQGMTSAPTMAIFAALRRRKSHIGFCGKTSFVYVDDVAKILIRCVREAPDDARVYNLRGISANVEEFITTFERIAPECRDMVTCGGSPIPIAWDLDDSDLYRDFPGLPATSLEVGIRKTVEHEREMDRARHGTG